MKEPLKLRSDQEPYGRLSLFGKVKAKLWKDNGTALLVAKLARGLH